MLRAETKVTFRARAVLLLAFLGGMGVMALFFVKQTTLVEAAVEKLSSEVDNPSEKWGGFAQSNPCGHSPYGCCEAGGCFFGPKGGECEYGCCKVYGCYPGCNLGKGRCCKRHC